MTNKKTILSLASFLAITLGASLASANPSGCPIAPKGPCTPKDPDAPAQKCPPPPPQKCPVVLDEDTPCLNGPCPLRGPMRMHHNRVMQRFLEELFGDLDPDLYSPRNFARAQNLNYPDSPQRFFPDCNLKENANGYVLTMELPGIPKDDIKISVDNNILSVSGEKRESVEEDNGTYKRMERSFGAFKRSFTLPENADIEKLKASCKDGILTIDIPKLEVKKSSAKEIPIN